MHTPNGIHAILFDLDGTLRHSRPSGNKTLFDLAAQMGVPSSPELRLRAQRWIHYYWAQSPELMGDIRTYGRLTDAFWTYYSYRNLVALECAPKKAEALAPALQRRMTVAYQPEDWVPPDVPETLEALKAAGYPLGVVSNRSDAYDEQLAELNLDTYFLFALAAGEINAWKPEAAIFHQAVELLGAKPGQTLYVGDNYYADVVGTQNAGLSPVLIDPEGVFPDAGCRVIHTIGELKEMAAAFPMPAE